MHGLGSSLILIGELKRGIVLLQGAFALREKLLGENHIAVAATACNLGDAYLKEEKIEEASKILERGRDILATVCGEYHPDYAVILMSMANVAQIANQPNEAEELILRAIEICSQTLGENSSQVISFNGSLATFYTAENRFDEAERIVSEIKSRTAELYGSVSLQSTALQYCEVMIALARQQMVIAQSRSAKYLSMLEQLVDPLDYRHREALRQHIAILRRLGLEREATRFSNRLQQLLTGIKKQN